MVISVPIIEFYDRNFLENQKKDKNEFEVLNSYQLYVCSGSIKFELNVFFLLCSYQ